MDEGKGFISADGFSSGAQKIHFEYIACCFKVK